MMPTGLIGGDICVKLVVFGLFVSFLLPKPVQKRVADKSPVQSNNTETSWQTCVVQLLYSQWSCVSASGCSEVTAGIAIVSTRSCTDQTGRPALYRYAIASGFVLCTHQACQGQCVLVAQAFID